MFASIWTSDSWNECPNYRTKNSLCILVHTSHTPLPVYTGGILQRLDTDVHSAVTAKMSTVLWQWKRAQHCDSKNEHSAVTAMVRIVILQHWQWQCWDISGYDANVTAMFTLVHIAVAVVTTDSAVSAVAADIAVTAMFTLVWQRWKLTVLCQRWQLTALWQRCVH